MHDQAEIAQVIFDRSVRSKWALELEEHEKQYLQFHKLQLPTINVVEKDPQMYPNGAMWRDTVRRQLRFLLLRVDFRTMILDETDVCVYSLARPEQAVPWTTIQECMKKLIIVRLRYTLEVIQSDDFEFEYDGPPLAIVDDVVVTTDNDVGLIDGESTTRPEITSVLTTYNNISAAGAGGVVGLAARPDYYFCLPEQEKEMQVFHDG